MISLSFLLFNLVLLVVFFIFFFALAIGGKNFIEIIGEIFFSAGIVFITGAAVSFGINQSSNLLIFLFPGAFLLLIGALLRVVGEEVVKKA